MTEHEIRENFLDQEYFNKLNALICWSAGNFAWYLCKVVGHQTGNRLHDWYLSHVVYSSANPRSSVYEDLRPFLNQIPDLKAILRVKVNFYPPTPEVITYTPHVDYDYEHKGALFSLNTCDGFTGLEDGTKVDSIENRILFFNPQTPHSASSTTSPKGRFNINVNYL